MEAVKRILEGKSAVVTGASRGIGEKIVRLFAENGASVIACARKQDCEFESWLSQLTDENGVVVKPVYFDLCDQESIRAGIKEIKLLKRPIDILVNNAGIGSLALVPMVSMAEMRDVFQVDYFAPVQLVQGLYRPLTKAKGCVINIASAAGIDGEPGNTVYGGAKAALILFTKVLAREMADCGVRVNAIAPGLTATGFADKMGQAAKESMVSASCMHRLANPDEIAKTALFLASDGSSFINGQVVRVDGGNEIIHV